MRLVLAAAALVLAGSSAYASSIVTIGGSDDTPSSIVARRCDRCDMPGKPDENHSAYKVPQLAKGTQKTEIVEINGQKKLARTEAWSGGSPVIFISKLPDSLAKDASVADIHPAANGSTEAGIDAADQTSDGVDVSATTSAVASNGPVQPLSPDQFELRLNPKVN